MVANAIACPKKAKEEPTVLCQTLASILGEQLSGRNVGTEYYAPHGYNGMRKKTIRINIMDELFDIEKILYPIDFSQGRETSVWEKILARLPHDDNPLSFRGFDNTKDGL